MVVTAFGLGLAALPWIFGTPVQAALFEMPLLAAWFLQILWITWLVADGKIALDQHMPLGPVRAVICAIIALPALPFWHAIVLLLLAKGSVAAHARIPPHGQVPAPIVRAARAAQELLWVAVLWSLVEGFHWMRWLDYLSETYVNGLGAPPPGEREGLMRAWLGPLGTGCIVAVRLLAAFAYLRVLVLGIPALYRGYALLEAVEMLRERDRAGRREERGAGARPEDGEGEGEA